MKKKSKVGLLVMVIAGGIFTVCGVVYALSTPRTMPIVPGAFIHNQSASTYVTDVSGCESMGVTPPNEVFPNSSSRIEIDADNFVVPKGCLIVYSNKNHPEYSCRIVLTAIGSGSVIVQANPRDSVCRNFAGQITIFGS